MTPPLGARPPAAPFVRVAPQPIDTALLELARQLGVSFGGDLHACGVASRGVQGRLSPQAAFDRLTRGVPCHIERRAGGAYVATAVRRQPASAHAERTARPAAVPAAPPEVVVTAGRASTLALADYAGAAAALDGPRLDSPVGRDLRALTSEIAAVESTNLGPGRDKLFLRGLSDGPFTGAAASTVAIYLDDLPIAYNAPDPDLRLADVDHVEVLEGPQGALYGAGAIGGVMRITPRRPDLETFSGAVELGGSATAHGGLGDEEEAVLNLPLLPGRAAVRVVGYREWAPGYIDDLGLGRRDVNGMLRVGVRASALMRLSAAWSATASATYQDLGDRGAQYAAGGYGPLARATLTSEPHDNDFGLLSLGLEGRLSPGVLKLSAAYIRHASQTQYDATDGVDLFAPGTTAHAAYDETHRRQLAFGEATFTSRPGRRSAWSVGAFLAHSTDTGRQLIGFDADPQLALYREDRRDQFDEAALFGEYAYRLTRAVTVRAGLRLFRSTVDTAAVDAQPAFKADTRAFSGAAVTLDAAPKLVLEYRPVSRLLLYASATTGYRPAGFNTSGPLGQTFDGAGPTPRRVAADTARTEEVGATWTASRLTVKLDVFHTDWLNIQSDQYSAADLPVTVNVGDGVIDGAEASGRWTFKPGLALSGSLLVDDPRLSKERNPLVAPAGDLSLPGVAPVSAALGFEASRTIAGWRAQAALRARYTGASHLTFQTGEVRRMGDIVSSSAELALARGFWSASLSVENLADAQGDTFGFGNPFSFAREQQSTPQRPRTVSLTLRRSF